MNLINLCLILIVSPQNERLSKEASPHRRRIGIYLREVAFPSGGPGVAKMRIC